MAHQKDITKNHSQPRGLLHRKLKIQRAEGNFGDEEQEPRGESEASEGLKWKSMLNSDVWKEDEEGKEGLHLRR